MRRILWLPFLAAACGFTSLLRADMTIVTTRRWDFGPEQGDFPGVGRLIEVTSIKAERMRVDRSFYKPDGFPSPDDPHPAFEIVNLKCGEVITMFPGRKEYIRHSMTRLGPYHASGSYICTLSGMDVSVCRPRAIRDYANLIDQMFDAYSHGQTTLWCGGSWERDPVRITYPVGDVARIRVVSVSAEPIDDSEFAIPAGYRLRKGGVSQWAP